MEIFKTFTFEAAHRLGHVPAEHKCSRLHGHSYRVRVYVSGPVSEQSGWIMDYGRIACAVKPILEQLDHTYLNEVPGLENPTSENLSRWIWARLAPGLPGLSAIEIRETPTSGCVYRGEA